MKKNPRDFFKNRMKKMNLKRIKSSEDQPLSPRSRSLRSHYRLRSEQQSKTCRCDLEKNGLSKISFDLVHHYLLELVYDICSTHFYSKGLKNTFEKTGIYPLTFSFVSQVEIYFFIEKFLQNLEVLVSEEKKKMEESKSNEEKTLGTENKTQKNETEEGDNENLETVKKLEVEEAEEEGEKEEEGHSENDVEDEKRELVLDDEYLDVVELRDMMKEVFYAQFEQSLEEEVIIPKSSFAHCISIKGKRNQNEDRFCIISDLLKVFGFGKTDFKLDYYAVFDGHGGYGAAEFCQIFLPGMIIEKAGSWTENDVVESLCESVTKAFQDIDERFEEIGSEYKCTSGTTATVVLVVETNEKKHVILANCGDSTGFLNVGGEIVAETIDHKPDSEDEKDRIELTGGRVTYLYGVARVMGSLGVSRAIGDLKVKKYGVISTPSIKVHEIDKSKEENNFFIIASDGLWDVMSQKFVNSYIMQSENGSSISSALAKMAVTRQTKDNVTIIYSKV